jgi:hypothetical protein
MASRNLKKIVIEKYGVEESSKLLKLIEVARDKDIYVAAQNNRKLNIVRVSRDTDKILNINKDYQSIIVSDKNILKVSKESFIDIIHSIRY